MSSKPLLRLRSITALSAALAALSTAPRALAIYPYSDCQAWYGTGARETWSYVTGTATLERLEGGSYVAVDQCSSAELLPSGGSFLISAPWTQAPANGGYRVRLDVVIYGGGSGSTPPTPAELANWPSSQIFTDTHTGNPFGCGPGGPVLTSTPPSSAVTGAQYTYDPTVSYSGSGSLVFTLPSAPTAEMTIDAASGHVAWVPAASMIGRRYAILHVGAPLGLFDLQAWAIDVAPGSAQPDSYLAAEDQSLAIGAVEGVLANDQNFTGAELESGPQHGEVSLGATGEFVYTPDPNFFGADSFYYTATNGSLTTDPVEVSIIVVASNDPPVFSAGPELTATEDQLYESAAAATDVDGDILTFELGQHPLGMTIDSVTGVLAWTPRSSQTGANPLVVLARDPAGAIAAHTSTITVTGINDAPAITSAPVTSGAAESAYSYLVRATDADIGDAIDFSLDVFPSGMTINAESGLISWTPGQSDIGDHPVTVRATDSAAASAAQSFTITVASRVPPVAAFRPAIPLNVALFEEGATIQSVSNESASGPARYAISAQPASANGWVTQSGHTANQYFVVDLAGELSHVVHGISIKGASTTNGARNIRVYVSPALEGDFAEVLAVEVPRDNELHRYDFDPLHARRVKLLAIDNYGNTTQLRVTHFEVHTRDGEGGVVSLFEGGASIVRATSETNPTGRPARFAIDFEPGSDWFAQAAPQTLTIALTGGGISHLVDRFRMYSPNGSSRSPRRFEVRVSNTTSDDAAFTPVLDATVADDRLPHWFMIPPVAAKYLQLVILETHGTAATEVLVEDFRAYSPARGGPNVSFDDFSSDSDGTIVRRLWNFGDGTSSLEEHPTHVYAQGGNYLVTLTVTDDSGLTSSSSLNYFAAAPPEPDFSWAPSLPIEGTQGNDEFLLTDLTPGTILDRAWSGPSPDFVGSAPARTPFLRDSGELAVTLTVTNTELLTRSITQYVSVANVAPEPFAGADRALYWGEAWPMDATVTDQSPEDRTNEMICHWNFGDSTSAEVTDCGVNNRIRVAKTFDTPGMYFPAVTATDKDGASATDSAAITVLPRPTNILVGGALGRTPAGEIIVRIELVDRYDLSSPIAGRELIVSGGGVSISAITDGSGTATVALANPADVSASFAGDLYFEPSSSGSRFSAAADPALPVIGAPSTAGSRGKSFVIAFGVPPVSVGLQFSYLHLGSVLHNFARVEIPAIEYDETFEILPGAQRQVQLPQSAWMTSSALLQQKGVRITSVRDLTVTGEARTSGWTDSFLALPADRLGRDYVVPGFPSSPGGPAIIITAVEDDTIVDIIPKQQSGPLLGDGVPDEPFTVELDRLQTYYLRGSAYPSGELLDRSGTEITANKPVAVFSGGTGQFPIGVPYFDYFTEMIPPTSAWRRQFVTTPFATRNSGYYARVFAAENATEVSIDGGPAQVIDRGEHLDLEVSDRSAHAISATRPVIVVQLSKSCGTDMVTICSGDPSMVFAPPLDQLAADIFASAPQAYLVRDPEALGTPGPTAFDQYLTVFAPLAELGGLRLDGAPISATWTPIGATGLATAELAVSPGRHRVRHISPIVKLGVIEHGVGLQESSAHSGEQHLTPFDASCVPSSGAPGDLADNDCDGRTDEELANNIDDEGDGLVDEDQAYGEPDTNLAPRANSFALTVLEDSPATLVLTASDQNGDPLEFDLLEAPPATAGTWYRYDPALLDPPPNGGAPPPLPTLSGSTNVGPAIRFVPSAGYSGTIYLRYLARDAESSSNTATATITVAPANDAPRMTSTPLLTATQGQLYTYAAAASDQDTGDTRTFFRVLGPTGLTIAPSGLVQWTPVNADVGTNLVSIGVMDAAGAIDTQSFSITVHDVNDAPAISGAPATSATAGATYTAQLAATDRDRGDQLRFSLPIAPPGMTVDPRTGLITWAPLAAGGAHPVTARVTDTGGLFATLNWEIEVGADTRPPRVSVTASPRIAASGQPITLTVIATDDVQVASTSLTVDGATVVLDGDGRATVSAGTEGIHRAIATAIDAGGSYATAETTYGVPVAGDATPPLAELVEPAEDAIITAPADIAGAAHDDHLLGYELSLARGDSGEFAVIASAADPVAGGTLGRLDPTLLENGLYRLKLLVTDANGQTSERIVPVQIQGGMKIGLFTLRFTDLNLPVSGIPITVTRTYDSRVKTTQDFGVGWKLDVSAGRYQHSRIPGVGWEFSPQAPSGWSGPYLPCVSEPADELQSHRTEVRLGEREFYTFAIQFANVSRIAQGCLAQVEFVQIDGWGPPATLEIIGNDIAVYQFNTTELRDDITLELFNPTEVRLTTHDGRVIDLERTRGITRLEDRNANELYIDDSGIVHSSGKNIAFIRDAAGRITTIVDPMGSSLVYAYDLDGDLESVTDQAGNPTTFTYDDRHNLIDVVDPLGVRAVRNEYDEDGRLIASIDPFGNRVELDHDLVERREAITNRLGYTIYKDYDLRGNIVLETYPGDPAVTISRTFDDRDNMLTETNELGETTTWTYDVETNDKLSETNALQETTIWTYDAQGRLLSESDERPATTAYAYDWRGNLASITDPEGFVRTMEYNTRGNLTRDCDPRGFCRRMQYDNFGNLTREIDRRGVPTLFTYDARGALSTKTTTRSVDGVVETLTTTFVRDQLGREVEVHNPDGSITRTEYDARGLVSSRFDALDRRTEYAYDDAGRQIEVRYADQTFESWSYDDEGRRTQSVDREGRTTTLLYDDRGRTIEMAAGGESSRIEYDLAGRVTMMTDRRGHETRTFYDAAGRVAQVRDALLQSTFYLYDAAGNVRAVTDAKNRTTTKTYDGRSLLVRVDHPDGTFETMAYDEAGNLVVETDEQGRSTTYAYDGAGHPISVTNAEEEAWTFAYDELGHLVAQTNPLSHTTSFKRDRVGRETSRRFAVGPAQLRSYDAAANLTRLTNYSGAITDYEYDANNYLSNRIQPEGTVSMTHSPIGRRLSTVDDQGTTEYTYDSRDRLAGITYPDGRSLAYTYDAEGNLTTMTVDAGSDEWTETYQYDQLNRLISVTSAGETFALTYDATGKLASLAYPNDLTTTYEYDQRDRVTSIVVRDVQENVVASWNYGRLPAGNIESVLEHDATLTEYEYDLADRVTLERVSVSGVEQTLRGFAYDDAGNRVEVSFTPAGQEAQEQVCTFDQRDRLLAQGADSFTWDQDGRLLQRTGPDELSVIWDSQDRLLRLDYADGSFAEHAYDADGVRILEIVTSSAGASQSSVLLVDPRLPLEHVAAEIDEPTGDVRARYVRANQMLLAVIRDGGNRYFHLDQLGSTRLLSAPDASIEDRYRYSPFGELVQHEGNDPNRYLFAGKPFDSHAQLSYNRARWMEPGSGRFLSIDPWLGVPSDPRTLATYVYAFNNPALLTDPTGRTSLAQTMFGLAVIATIAAVTTVSIDTMLIARISQMEATVANLPLLPDNTPASRNQLQRDRVRDAFQHCLASCVVSNDYGTTWANICGWLNEEGGSNSAAERAADEHNNSVGRKLGKSVGAAQDCYAACTTALVSGSCNIREN